MRRRTLTTAAVKLIVVRPALVAASRYCSSGQSIVPPTAAAAPGVSRVALDNLLARLRQNGTTCSMQVAADAPRPSLSAKPPSSQKRNAQKRTGKKEHRRGSGSPSRHERQTVTVASVKEESLKNPTPVSLSTSGAAAATKLRNPFASVTYPSKQKVDWSSIVNAQQGEYSLAALRLHCEAWFSMHGKVASDGGYDDAVLQVCVAPLLRFMAGMPLECQEIVELLPFLSVDALRAAVCRNTTDFFVFSSDEPPNSTITVLDSSREFFLRHVYQSIHLSFEPVEVVARRLGLPSNVVPTAQLVKFFARFSALNAAANAIVELGILHRSNSDGSLLTVGLPPDCAVPSEDVVVIRRANCSASGMAPLSVVEIARLLGDPLVSPPRVKDKVGHPKMDGYHVYDAGVQMTQRRVDLREPLLAQARTVRLGAYAVPSRYLGDNGPPGSATGSVRRVTDQASNGANTKNVLVAPAPIHVPARAVHDLRVRIVTLKQRARLSHGQERQTLLWELSAAKAKLQQLTAGGGGKPTPDPATPSPSDALSKKEQSESQKSSTKGPSRSRFAKVKERVIETFVI